METIFMNTENSRANESHRFRLSLLDKPNLKYRNKDMALVNLSIYYTWKNIKSAYNNINVLFLLQLGVMNLIYLMDLIVMQTVKTTLNISSKNKKL